MVKRIVDTAFWTDMQVIDNYSVEDKFFYLYLLTNAKSTQIGIYSLPKKVMSFETGFTTDVIQVLLERFTKTYGKIHYSEKTQEVTILESLQFSVLTGGKPVQDLLEREISKVKDGALILATYESMQKFWQLSKRKFDHTIMALFEKEMTSRKITFAPTAPQNEKQNQKQTHLHNQLHSQSHHHNQESSLTSRQKLKTKPEEKAIIDRYIQYIKQSSLQPERVITYENILEVFYEELVGRVTPEVKVRLEQWVIDYPKSFILEALHRSLKAKKPISYAASIMDKWQDQGVTTYQDIIKLDRAFHQRHQ